MERRLPPGGRRHLTHHGHGSPGRRRGLSRRRPGSSRLSTVTLCSPTVTWGSPTVTLCAPTVTLCAPTVTLCAPTVTWLGREGREGCARSSIRLARSSLGSRQTRHDRAHPSRPTLRGDVASAGARPPTTPAAPGSPTATPGPPMVTSRLSTVTPGSPGVTPGSPRVTRRWSSMRSDTRGVAVHDVALLLGVEPVANPLGATGRGDRVHARRGARGATPVLDGRAVRKPSWRR